MVAATTTPLVPFEAAPAAAPTPNDIADDHSLLKIDRELDFLMEQIEDEIEESGEASKEAMDRLQLFCQAMNVKVDRIGRYLSVMETRGEHCRQEAARYAQRAKRRRTKSIARSAWSFITWRTAIRSRSNPTTSPCGGRRIYCNRAHSDGFKSVLRPVHGTLFIFWIQISTKYSATNGAVFLVIETHFTLFPAKADHVLETLRSSTMMVMKAATHTVRECGHASGVSRSDNCRDPYSCKRLASTSRYDSNAHQAPE
jgi:hypothetical protein